MKEEDREPGTFLERWSRRKRGLETEAEQEAQAIDAKSSSPSADASGEATGNGKEAAEPVVEKDFADFDFDKLDYDSDYKQFMEKDVSQDARHKALRKLWVSSPVLSSIDGLDDYCEDYTDAAVCLPKGTMKTLYQYGRGFLDDDEVAEWEALGQESKEIAEAEAKERQAKAEAASNAGQDKVAEATEASSEAAATQAVADANTVPGAADAAAVKQEEA